MTLAQETDIILLGKPITYLDMTHQIEVLDLLFGLNELENRTIVMVLHDINLTFHKVALKDKAIYAQGRPEEVINGKLVQEVFQMEYEIVEDPILRTPLCIPHGKGRRISTPI